MDPDKNLQEQVMLASKFIEAFENERPIKDVDVYRLSELVLGLDEWVRQGGFLPGAWRSR